MAGSFSCVNECNFSLLLENVLTWECHCRYITSKPQHWQTSFGLVVLDIAEGGRFQLSLGLTHTMNHQDFGEKVERRSDLMWEVKRLLEELQMEYRLPSQEVHVKTLPGTTISTGSST